MPKPNQHIIPLLILAATTPFTFAQSFPILPLSEPTYPADLHDLPSFHWDTSRYTITTNADLNNDGYQDIIVYFNNDPANTPADSSPLWIYYADTKGQYTQPIPAPGFTVELGSQVQDILINDHNNDGQQDIVLLSDTGTQITPWLNINNHFSQAMTLDIPTKSPADTGRFMLIDFNDDNLKDYAIWTNELQIDVWIAQSNNDYTHQSISPSVSTRTENAGSIGFSDFDGDGDKDFITTNGMYYTYWIENVKGAFSSPALWNLNFQEFSIDSQITFADVNGDQKTDLIMLGEHDPSDNDAVIALLSPFTITLENASDENTFAYSLIPETHNYLRTTGILPSADNWNESFFSPGDLDGDGTDDLIVFPEVGIRRGWRISDPINIHDRYSITEEYAIHGLGEFDTSTTFYDERIALKYAYIDVNQDSIRDRISVTTTRKHVDLDIEEPNPNGFALWTQLANPFDPNHLSDFRDLGVTGNTIHITDADLDLDGSPELISTWSSRIHIIDQDDDGYYSQSENTLFEGYHAGFRSIPAQLDSDPAIDLVSHKTNSDSPFPAVYLNVQLGTEDSVLVNPLFEFDAQAALDMQGIEFHPHPTAFDTADIDNDGDIDILLRGDFRSLSEGRLLITWINDGDANFSFGTLIELNEHGTDSQHSILTNDHDHDGDLDLICVSGDRDLGNIDIYNNDGSGNFTLETQIPIHSYLALEPYWNIESDIDADGFKDIVFIIRNNFRDCELVIVYGSPTGFSSPPQYIGGQSAVEVIAVDLDQNGLVDLVTSSSQECLYDTRFSVSIAYQTAPRVFAPLIAINDTCNTSIMSFDINQDGHNDLVATYSDENRYVSYLSMPTPCPVDLNLDQRLNFFDITLFIQFFSENKPLADLNHDNRFNFFDITLFLSQFNAGCP